MYTKIINFLKDKNIAIVGFGKEGISTYKFIRKYLNQKITIIDKNESLLENNPYLKEDKNLNLVLGDNYLDDLNVYDLIIKSPGVKFKDIDTSFIIDKITSQLGLILDFYKDNIIGITGSKGKSTTTSLIYNILKDQGIDAYLLGNIGIPIFDYVDLFEDDSVLVIEMAALQLEYVKSSPHIGMVLNLFEEHLDFFKTKDDYYLAKMNMFKYQSEKDFALYSSKNDTLNYYVNNQTYLSRLIDIDKSLKIEDSFVIDENNNKIYNINDERYLLGLHNLSNICFSLYVSKILELDLKETIKTINNFKCLEHRMEYVGEVDGIKYYNDAIATIPSATINCVNALGNVDTLIFGGMDRGIDYTSLVEFFNNSDIDNFICMRDTGHTLAPLIKNKNVYLVETLEEAVTISKKVTKNICVLSPAASSYNSFKNFEEKGRIFKELVLKNK